MTKEELMRKAIELSKENVENGGVIKVNLLIWSFGSLFNNQYVGCLVNLVLKPSSST